METKHSNDDLVVSIRRYTAHLGRPPTASEVEDDDVFTAEISAYCNQFGSWEAALAAAGVDNDRWSGVSPISAESRSDPRSIPEWSTLREQTIQADGEVCQRCGISRSEYRSRFGVDLHVHLIQPLTEFCVDDCGFGTEVTRSTMITLCAACHSYIAEADKN